MYTHDFDYNLPDDLIAQSPATPRDSSRLMVIDKNTHKVEHKHFFDITNYLQAGDLLVWNISKVFKARLRGMIELDQDSDDIAGIVPSTNKILNVPKQVEIFLVRPMENVGVWKVLAKPGRKLRLGMKVVFAPDFSCEVMTKENDGTILVQFGDDDAIVREKANKYGEVPTPPYIKVDQDKFEAVGVEDRYQTVYARVEGSVAAPTAGFHFTPELIEQLKNKGVEFAEVTLHVGLGTFLPVKTEKIEDHKMHSEWVEMTAANADKINLAKHEGRRVVAVGTTTVRVLEGVANSSVIPSVSEGSPIVGRRNKESSHSPACRQAGFGVTVKAYVGDINIFIAPGYKFKIVDALITNFHLPKSTLLMLVSAFADDRKFLLECYRQAVEEKYRFYSFGDAMLIK
ncbi:MAG: tRNA preQ1(34) S-adenosylmethionine ribosyltransferase-isomerase QueA [Candidatus Magasanikbacteria bacterium]